MAAMNRDICFADATELARRIRDKQVSPVEVVSAHLERVFEINPKLNAVVTLADDAMDKARAAEQSLAKGEDVGPLHGVPFTCKDAFDVAGVRTTRGSKLFEHHVAEGDAPAVARLKRAGGIFLGKTNVPEFILWWETDNLVFGRTNNPWNTDLTPGGSSGGEAAAIATGASPLGVGSDVGGSIRMPAHYCGIVGFKPTHGRVPLTGHWPQALLRANHVGPMARTVRDIGLALRLMSGPDGADPYCVPVESPAIPLSADAPLKLRVGWHADGAFSPVDPEVAAVVEKAAVALQSAGCVVEHVELPVLAENPGVAVSGPVWGLETGYYFEPFVKGRESELYPFMRKRLGNPWPEVRDYLKALQRWEALRRATTAYFHEYDLLLCPTVPLPAYAHGLTELTIDGTTVPARHKLNTTLPWDLTGSPALSLPFGMSGDGLPIGVQIVGRHFDESTVLSAALALEAVSDVRELHPPLP
jgi:aspartyl-tRNA(Asn)/glutamyl-tRNA(Gln) amidotransferase subunit A